MRAINILLLVGGLAASRTVAAMSRSKFNFNSNWKLYVGDDIDETDALGNDYDTSDWDSITLPHAWNEDDAFAVRVQDLSTGISYYRKDFDLPDDIEDDSKVFLEFEGIRQGGDFYVNGEFVGRSENGVMAFGFDVTDLVSKDSTNYVAARIDNDYNYEEIATGTSHQWNSEVFYANYGGINKNTYLHITKGAVYQTLPLYSNLNTTGVYIYGTDYDIEGATATIHAESEVVNDSDDAMTFTYEVVVMDPEGNEFLTFSGDEAIELESGESTTVKASKAAENVEFWSWGYGYLYTVETRLVTDDGEAFDTVQTVTGFRKTAFENGMFLLNDRPLQVKGYAQRSTNEWPALGCSYPPWMSDLSNNLMVASGGNTVRWMHVTPGKQDVESSDRVGLMMAMPAGDKEGDAEGRQWEQRVELMRDATIYNRNNPSVIWYEAGNHGISEEHMSEMKAIRDEYDPNGGRASGSREMMDSTVAEYGGEMLYINKGSDIPFWSMEYMRDEGLRQYWDNFTEPWHLDGTDPDAESGAYDRNQDSYALEQAMLWSEYYSQRPGTGERVNAGGVNIVWSDSNTHYRGSVSYRTSGEVDAVRLEKPDAFGTHRVMWGGGWVDIDVPDVHIVGHWNYAGNSTNETAAIDTKTVHVISTASSVALYLDDELLADEYEQEHGPFVFSFPDTPYSAGKLEARAYEDDSKETVVATDVRVTTGEAVGLRLTTHVNPGTKTLTADGADIVLVDVEVIDSDGNRVPTALNMIDFDLDDPDDAAEWRGGIGDNANDNNNYILATSLPVAQGIQRVIIRSTTNPGTFKLHVSDSNGQLGDDDAVVEITSEPPADSDMIASLGLGTLLPSHDLPANLTKGPTPTSGKPSFTPTRKTLPVVSVSAGSEASSDDGDNLAEYAVDSNEETSWRPDGDADRDDRWISFFLDETSEVSQVVIKLRDFKNPTDVTVLVGSSSSDDEDDDMVTAWDGEIPETHGYYTIIFDEAVEGDKVTLTNSVAFGIKEVEFYGPV